MLSTDGQTLKEKARSSMQQQLNPPCPSHMSPFLPGEDWAGLGEPQNVTLMDASSIGRETLGVGKKFSPHFTDVKTEVT